MSFHPPQCPFEDCPTRKEGRFRPRLRGHYRRRCDGRTVRRFACERCLRSFSSQTYRLDYRLRRIDVWAPLFMSLVSKVTLRQCARHYRCTRKTVELRMARFGAHCRALHLALLERARARGGLGGTFQLDELETFEHNRRLAPLTVPVLIERESYFVLWAGVASLPARGGLRAEDRRKKKEREALLGVRRSGSRRAVAQALERLAWAVKGRAFTFQSDEKHTYQSEIRKRFGGWVVHERYSSKEPRKYGSKLFPINHTLALMRDGISRLVRRSWAASKQARFLELHQWIWICWRNYVRRITNRCRTRSAAMVFGTAARRVGVAELLAARPDDLRCFSCH